MFIDGENKIGVYVAGAFDMLHYGHVRFLERAKRLGDVLFVGLVTDEAVESVKGKKPIMNYDERYEVLRALRCIYAVARQNDPYPTKLLKELKDHHNLIFDILVRSDDVQEPIPGQEFIEENGGKVVILPYTNEISSSDIKKRIRRSK